mmetsp:Transcript_117092/g.338475  ORF Transcript_117092/g.338475 Transcript_117092/m.338475 type:complete len:160 (-) Transcript_117092:258-737(-)
MAPMLLGAPQPAALAEKKTPNFSGEWVLDRSENQEAFLRSIGYTAIVARTADRAQARQAIEHVGDEMRCRFETVPPLAPARLAVLHVGDEEVRTCDEMGRETALLKPAWKGEVLTAGLRYLKLPHELRMERYMQDGLMVEHLRYPRKGVEMRRLFKRSA